jgi:hypothetical protein
MQGFLSAVSVLSKVCMLLFTACFMQIPFSEHLVIQGLQVGCRQPCAFVVAKLLSRLPDSHGIISCTYGVAIFMVA